jgi:hypothetical protein
MRHVERKENNLDAHIVEAQRLVFFFFKLLFPFYLALTFLIVYGRESFSHHFHRLQSFWLI